MSSSSQKVYHDFLIIADTKDDKSKFKELQELSRDMFLVQFEFLIHYAIEVDKFLQS